MNFYLFKQLPVLPPSRFSRSQEEFIAARVLHLTGHSRDLDAWRCELAASTSGVTPEDNPALARAELDAVFAALYGLDRRDLEYILDPSSFDEDYPSETFRVLKQNEFRRFGEYRTRRLVLEAWDRLTTPSSSGSAALVDWASPGALLHPRRR
jgi:hypothetical protein